MISERTILVVDDDSDIRGSVADALEEEGYRVVCASNGKDALHLLRDERLRPDLILLDMMMPEMDGWAFRGEQRKDAELASIPVVVFTAYGVPSETANQLGAAGFLKKPPRLDDLLRAVVMTG
ncbi:response regulator [Archangium sp.]|uniref:response regulator n=1 Tax=Archangium sp. TaxID=1872627 RepID=UPI002D5C3AE0|nr:response regulator [Archangium sp.]HYO51868.1 response regulator [Archangium sp.]